MAWHEQGRDRHRKAGWWLSHRSRCRRCMCSPSMWTRLRTAVWAGPGTPCAARREEGKVRSEQQQHEKEEEEEEEDKDRRQAQSRTHRSMNLKGAMSGRPLGPYTVKKRSPVQFSPYRWWKV